MVIQWALVITLCTGMNTPAERCDDYVNDMLPTMQECQHALAETAVALGDTRVASLSCEIARVVDKDGKK